MSLPPAPKSPPPPLAEFDRRLREGVRGPLAGVDEAGRGPLAGPVVAAAVIVREEGFTCRIDDSKKLTPRMRRAAYEEILRRAAVSIAWRDRRRIDEINIFRATLEAMREAVEKLPERPALVLVDGPASPELTMNSRPVVGGDALSLSIACASIVAKVVRDRMMEDYHREFPDYGFDRHKGYGTAAHFEALRTHGPCEIHRRSFEPVSSLLSLHTEVQG